MVSTSSMESSPQSQSQQQQNPHNKLQEFHPGDALRGARPSPNSSVTQRSTVASAVTPAISILPTAPAGYDDATELQQWEYRHREPSHNPSDDSNRCETPELEVASRSTECRCSGPAATPDDSSSSNCSRGASPPPPNGPAVSVGKMSKSRSMFAAFWNNHMSVVVPSNAARDHLALERTYLAYHRTSLVFAIFAAITAQLTVIQQAPNPPTTFGFRHIGKPISILLVCFSLVVSVLGVLRWWRLQSGLLRGAAIAGGLEVWGLAGGIFLVGSISRFFLLHWGCTITRLRGASLVSVGISSVFFSPQVTLMPYFHHLEGLCVAYEGYASRIF
ncbi:hypothetical protein C7212DRAFT_284782 [Tuber magnatum]|uniref:DUF202 domain-containing protein n=1 Tax=Tuber magnatum TaxID=42249 RepID=A0A317SFI5_9PEZI|nr:hypothetical protein C7212DRAFT_284782 [Tuber magnatum]